MLLSNNCSQYGRYETQRPNSEHARYFKFVNLTANQTSLDATALYKCKLFDRELYRQFWRIYLYL